MSEPFFRFVVEYLDSILSPLGFLDHRQVGVCQGSCITQEKLLTVRDGSYLLDGGEIRRLCRCLTHGENLYAECGQGEDQ